MRVRMMSNKSSQMPSTPPNESPLEDDAGAVSYANFSLLWTGQYFMIIEVLPSDRTKRGAIPILKAICFACWAETGTIKYLFSTKSKPYDFRDHVSKLHKYLKSAKSSGT